MKTDIPCVIVAGGKSSRMGTNKALLPFGKHSSVLQYQLTKYRKICSSVHISAKKPFTCKASYIIDNDKQTHSPLIALKSSLEQLKKAAFFISVDTPFVKQKTLKELALHVNDYDIIVAKSPNHLHPMCAIYSYGILHVIDKQISKNEHKIRALLDEVNTKYVEFASDDEFLNMNYKDDYKKGLAQLLATK